MIKFNRGNTIELCCIFKDKNFYSFHLSFLDPNQYISVLLQSLNGLVFFTKEASYQTFCSGDIQMFFLKNVCLYVY